MYIILYYIILYHFILYYIVLYYIILYYIILYYIIYVCVCNVHCFGVPSAIPTIGHQTPETFVKHALNLRSFAAKGPPQ